MPLLLSNEKESWVTTTCGLKTERYFTLSIFNLRLLCGFVWVFWCVAGPEALGDDILQIVEEIKAAKRRGETAVTAEFPEKGFISDPDGFTNVRSGPGTKHLVVAVTWSPSFLRSGPESEAQSQLSL